jgi:hypothetical protein
MLTLFLKLHRLPALVRVALAVWVALLIGVAVNVVLHPRTHTVVPIYLSAAQHWVSGENLYGHYWPLDVYRNPPGVAAAFVPLLWVPEWVAGLIWRGLSAAVFLTGLAVWVRHGLPRKLTASEAGALFALTAIPAAQSLNNGQTNLLIIGALLFGATAVARCRGLASGGWLALATAIKVYPAAVALLLAAGNPRRVVLPFVVACAGFAAVPFLLRDTAYVIEQHRGFHERVTVDDRTFADPGRAPQDVFLVLRTWVVAPSPTAYLGFKLAFAAGMAGLVVLAARRVRDPRAVSLLAFNLGCVWVTALGPATEPQTYTILGPTAAAVLVFAVADRREPGGLARLALALTGYVFLAAPTARDVFPNGGPFHNLALQPMGGMLVLAAVVWAGIRDTIAGPTATTATPDTTRRAECPTAPASAAPARAA